ncbi:putative bifunctional diguanylate cyclase/phosphodiesterase [Salisediminibacterium beveridgei]|uniref:Diguanylate cyclase/phosphodiesterase (GGDEF & EAL domains) with PAS/PAC sensor(S) n=1 Tax=Salisediminibacterium beveridgei TaxID=632773 RepID=A0A1D7QTT7_9BACI|nr:GGDEF domain-containing protein [Salisediminibacterium beveridgei]AOM82395.1 diguanylate cyclase/phosphodiesterase (GGDEF & EAL domains) with PAS/PAC sensor(s) [Salisediminibacterium beveridgei]
MSRKSKSVELLNEWIGEFLNTEYTYAHTSCDLTRQLSLITEIIGESLSILVTDDQDRLVYASDSYCSLFTYEKEFPSGAHIDDVIQFRFLNDHDMRALNQARQSSSHVSFDCVQSTAFGKQISYRTSFVPIKDHKQVHRASLYVIADQKPDKQGSVVQQEVVYDQMTGLKNRDQFELEVEQKCQNQHEDAQLALLFFDLDRFKYYNATLGQLTGDRLLKEVATRLTAIQDQRMEIYRFGGDQFAILIEGYPSMTYIHKVAKDVCHFFKQPFVLSNHELKVSASVGVSLLPDTAKTKGDLIHQAEMAMQVSKEKGPSTYHVYIEEMHCHYTKQLTLEKRLNKAIEEKSFQLHYQPQYDFYSQQVVGFEALIRWFDEDLGYVPPDQFITVAEETGLIIPIGRQVLDQACQKGKDWYDNGLNIRVGVNVSPVQFQHPDFIQSVKWTLVKTGLPAERLDIEITENVLLYNKEACMNTLEQLKAIGVHISIDDFGTGFSSLSYLRTFPVDMLKIDQSFVRELKRNHNDQAIVTSIIQLAHNMGMKVIAEGVETSDSLNFLMDQHCDQMQGYLYSRPIPPEQLPLFLTENRVMHRSSET